jgi:protein phosphatase
MKTPIEVKAARLQGGGEGGSIHVEVYAVTDVGQTREHNEDAYLVSDLARGQPIDFDTAVQQRVGARGLLFMVADGMGGAAAGELASATAVDVVLRSLRDEWATAAATTPAAFVDAIERAAQTANSVIYRYATEHPEVRGMGTTATIAGLLGDTVYLAQVGDSRAYLIRDGVARQLTKDQSLIQKLVEAGEMTEEQAEHSERKNIILQALGPEAHIKVDLTHQQLRRDDVLVLCSDGLSGLIKGEDIARCVREAGDLLSACQRMVDLANEHGGPDNITVVGARFDGAGLKRAAAEDAVGHQLYERGGTPDAPGRDLDSLLRERSAAMMAGTPIEPFPAAVVAERRRRGLMIRAGLAGAAALLSLYLLWKWL